MLIPQNIRKLENLHIVFWLFKDMSWCMGWKYLGMTMILPTLGVSLYTTFKTKHLPAEWYHNLAILCWILANSYWMISEFYGFDEKQIAFGIQGKHFSIIPFGLGVVILSFYYLKYNLFNSKDD